MRKKRTAQRFNDNKNNKLIFLICGIIILFLGIGTTNALILLNSEQKNTFQSGNIACEIQSDYSIKNTGNANAYIRATVIANWKDDNGNLHTSIPDYQITLGDNWKLNNVDGYYYYDYEVKPNEKTTILTSDITTNDTAPDGYVLSVTILTEAMQISDDNKSIEETWGVN